MPPVLDPDEVVRRLAGHRRELWLEATLIAQRTWPSRSPTQDEVRRFYELTAMIEEIDRRIGKLRVTEDPVPLRVVMRDD